MRGAILRVAKGHAIGIGEIVRSPPILFVKTVREFVPNSGAERQIVAQLDDVLNIPGAYCRPPVHDRLIGNAHEVHGDPFQEGLEAGKVCLSISPTRRVRVHLDALNPDAETHLVLPADELHIIRSGEEVSIVPDISGNAAASRSE